MAWLVSILGGILVIAGFDDKPHGHVVFTTADKYGVIIGAVLIIAGLISETRSR